MRYARIWLAVAVAVLGGLFWCDRPLGRLRDAWRLLRASVGVKKVTLVHFENRMDACRECPIYHPGLQTCGSPLKNHDLGCWCHMPTKAWLKEATCWLDDHAQSPQPFGWKEL